MSCASGLPKKLHAIHVAIEQIVNRITISLIARRSADRGATWKCLSNELSCRWLSGGMEEKKSKVAEITITSR